MKNNRILSALLLTTSLSGMASEMENSIHTQTREFNLMNPNRSFARQVATNVDRDVRQGLTRDMQEFGSLLAKISKGEWDSIAGVGINEIIHHLNGQFLSRYNLPTNSGQENEFTPESLKPFLKAFREKATIILQGWLGKDGNSYAYNSTTGEKYPIFTNTPFNQLADFFIPGCIPMRDLLISICNSGPVNEYLGNKLDELAINSLKTIAPLALRKAYAFATTDYEHYISLPALTKENNEKSHYPSLLKEVGKPNGTRCFEAFLDCMEETNLINIS